MKKLLNYALGLALLTGLVGCGDDDPTPPPVNTNPTLEFKQNDKYRYAYYERDSVTNTRIDTSRRVKDWTVIQTGLTVGGRANVSKIEEITFSDQAGTIEQSRDTFYFQATASGNGEILQYNVLSAVMRRFLAVLNYSDSIPARWVKITDTKVTDPISWNSLIAGNLTTQITIDVFGTPFQPTVTMSMTAAHKGTVATTVAAGPYPSAVHTDHSIVVVGSIDNSGVQTEIARDTLKMSYDLDSKTGLLRQVLNSGKFTPKGSLALVPGIRETKIQGFELELVSVNRAK